MLSPQWVVAIIAAVTMVVQVLLSWNAIRWHQHYQKEKMDERHAENQRALAAIQKELSENDEWRERYGVERGRADAEHREHERRLTAIERELFKRRREP